MGQPQNPTRQEGDPTGWRRLRALLASASTLVACGAASAVIFHLNHSDYIRWYVKNGSTIALVMSIVSLAIDLDLMPGLISARVDVFVRTCVNLIELPAGIWLSAVVPSSISRFYMPSNTSSWTGSSPPAGKASEQSASETAPHQDPTAALWLLLVESQDSHEVLHRLRVLGAYQKTDGRPEFFALGGPWRAGMVLTGSHAWVTNDGQLRLTVTDRDGKEHVVVPDFSRGSRSFAPGPGRRVSGGKFFADILATPMVYVVAIVVVVALFAWFVVLAPLQYLTFLICGSLMRAIQDQELSAFYDPAKDRVRPHWTGRPLPKNVTETRLRRHPVTTTLAVSSLCLWLLSTFLKL